MGFAGPERSSWPWSFAALVPYVIVGVFMASIILLSWLVTMLLLPAVIGLAQRARGVPVPALDGTPKEEVAHE